MCNFLRDGSQISNNTELHRKNEVKLPNARKKVTEKTKKNPKENLLGILKRRSINYFM